MDLPRSTPAEQGIDARGIEKFLDAVEVELHSVMLLRHGHVVAEGWWAPYRRDQVHLLYSLSKSFTSTAIGLAVEEGRLSVTDPVVSFFPEHVPADASPYLERMQVHHVLSMGTGHVADTTQQVMRQTDRHPIAAFFAIPPDKEPGSVFAYNSTATYILSAIITKLTGQSLTEYLRPRLFDPLGIDQAYWQKVGAVDQGYSGLHVTTESIAKLGQLYLQRGKWDGRQILPESWVAAATKHQIDTVTPWRQSEPPDWQQGYGYQFWQCRHGAYRGDGAHGQFCLVIPESDVVLATTAATSDMQAVLDAAWEHLLPAIDSPADSGSLSSRLAGLALPTIEGSAGGAGPWEFSAAASDDGFPINRSVTVTAENGGWSLVLDDTLTVHCGHGSWVEGTVLAENSLEVPVVSCGAWTTDSIFEADLIFLDTPNRIRVRCDTDAGTFRLSWNMAVLNGPQLSRLAAPRPAHRP
ncbi:MAG TPA: serine hydrolase [Mycobacteriales bacterium]|nr:serine hydrolase [Mycobacteriales bacterium]